MVEKCEICKAEIEEEYGKLKGTMIKVVEDKKARFIHVCSECQKDSKHIEIAKVKSA